MDLQVSQLPFMVILWIGIYITRVVGAKGTKGDRGYYGFRGKLINLHCNSMGPIVL